MDGVSSPVKTLAISIGRIKGTFELFDAFFTTGESENAFCFGGYKEISCELA